MKSSRSYESGTTSGGGPLAEDEEIGASGSGNKFTIRKNCQESKIQKLKGSIVSLFGTVTTA